VAGVANAAIYSQPRPGIVHVMNLEPSYTP